MQLDETYANTLELAVRIADDAARADIETSCPSFTGDGREPMTAEEIRSAWYDVAGAGTESRGVVEIALHYLTLRGKIIHHPSRNTWVRLTSGCAGDPLDASLACTCKFDMPSSQLR